jgi:hypothetical protein
MAVVQVRLTVSKGLRLMRYTPSADVSQLLRVICHAPGHEGDERDEQRDKAVLAVIVLGGPNRGGQDFGEHNDCS